MSLSKAQALKIALSFPGAAEKSSHGHPAVFVNGKLLAQIGCREPQAVMFRTDSIEERDMLIAGDPETFYVTDHFKDYKGALARLGALDAESLRSVLERRWRAIAPRELLISSRIRGEDASRRRGGRPSRKRGEKAT
ncbi:MAG: MmcQ/YjbR family DNA-binding protein [Alphaproteobacteria bacterium]|nr:MmcQ/YjbR family DNA-binding protein [Alphaproteobacteria bacterium]